MWQPTITMSLREAITYGRSKRLSTPHKLRLSPNHKPTCGDCHSRSQGTALPSSSQFARVHEHHQCTRWFCVFCTRQLIAEHFSTINLLVHLTKLFTLIGKTNADADEMWSMRTKSMSGSASSLSVNSLTMTSSDSIGIGMSTET